MNNFRESSVVAEPGKLLERENVDIDPLFRYESQSTGKEFDAYVPVANERRVSEARRDETIVKTWRGKPITRSARASYIIRDELSSVREFETKRVVDSERLFVIVLTGMTLLLGAIFMYFVMNFHF